MCSCEICRNAIEMQTGFETIRLLLPGRAAGCFLIHSFISSNCTVTAFSSPIPQQDCWAAIAEGAHGGLRAHKDKRGMG